MKKTSPINWRGISRISKKEISGKFLFKNMSGFHINNVKKSSKDHCSSLVKKESIQWQCKECLEWNGTNDLKCLKCKKVLERVKE